MIHIGRSLGRVSLAKQRLRQNLLGCHYNKMYSLREAGLKETRDEADKEGMSYKGVTKVSAAWD